jgi:hypothetical protein
MGAHHPVEHARGTRMLGTVMNKCRYLDERDGYGSEYY